MLRNAAMALILILVSLVAYAMAGPFGLEKGMSLKDIGGKPTKVANGSYRLDSVPKPHSAFEKYVVQIAPKGGLFCIRAIGKDIATSSYGLELHDAFEVMRSKLTAAYGGHVTMDTLLPGSIWSEPNEWMMGLLKKERVLGALWGTEQGSSLPTDLKSIGMMAFATTLDKGYITVEYYFTNFDSCEVELNAEEDDGL